MKSRAADKPRQDYVDSLRGLAVLVMVCWHTASGWLEPELQQGFVWANLLALGGLAAPLFLLIVGVSIQLRFSSEASAPKQPFSVHGALVKRGAFILLLGYLLRFQMWFIDVSIASRPRTWKFYLPILLAFALALTGLSKKSKSSKQIFLYLGFAIFFFFHGYARLYAFYPHRLYPLLRVDILQTIGLSLILIGSVHQLRSSITLSLGIASLLLLIAPFSNNVLPGFLPEPIAAYLGHWSEQNQHASLAMFPISPWFAYVLLGLVLGNWWRNPKTKAMSLACIAGLFLAYVISEDRRFIYNLLQVAPNLIEVIRALHRLAWALALGGFLYLADLFLPKTTFVLRRFGKSSLLVYWLHLSFAFGKGARLFKPVLSYQDWLEKALLLTLILLALAIAKQELSRHFARARRKTSKAS
ncbi:MAG: DUF1624 domain-containing protein [Myxococcales bacterium]|nr:MAG: DUF1624 domain-containing protein [Myxococcales bacterium]